MYVLDQALSGHLIEGSSRHCKYRSVVTKEMQVSIGAEGGWATWESKQAPVGSRTEVSGESSACGCGSRTKIGEQVHPQHCVCKRSNELSSSGCSCSEANKEMLLMIIMGAVNAVTEPCDVGRGRGRAKVARELVN